VIVDWTLPDGRGLDLVREFSGRFPEIRWICISATERPELVREAADLGVLGFVLKRCDAATFRHVVREVVAGRASYCPESARLLVEAVVAEHGRVALTPREREVLRRTARGQNTKEIAESLGTHPKTVNNLLSALKDKLGVAQTAGLVLYALKHGIAEPP
jgi:DNA-binding NarL/FixJ family response regulator